jgi:RNA polymerase sigma-70 factor (ECF subfamily)
MTQPDPRDIAQRATQRDPAAFEQIYDEHVDVVFRYVYYKVSDKDVAEDLTAEVFAKAWERIDRFQWRNVPVQHWLLTIARNMVIDYYRSHRKPTSPIDELIEAASEDPLPEDHVARDVDVETLGRALARLPDEQRDVLLLRFIEDYSHKDVATVLGKSDVAIRQIQVRALKALRAILEESGANKRVKPSSRGLRALPRRGRPTNEEAAT